MTTDSPYHSLTSYGGHTKRIVIIGAGVIAAVALIYYFSLPGHGERTSLPPDLGIAVRDHFKDNENRAVTEMRSFRCDIFNDGGNTIQAPDVTVEVVLENRPARLDEDERTKRWVVLATYRGDRRWDLSALQKTESSDPCKR